MNTGTPATIDDYIAGFPAVRGTSAKPGRSNSLKTCLVARRPVATHAALATSVIGGMCARLLSLALLPALLGCAESPPPKHIQAWVDSWAEMGMFLPDDEQVEFLRTNFADVAPELAEALAHENPDVRMRAAYVIDELGSDAASLGPALAA